MDIERRDMDMGKPFEAKWRVHSGGNSATQPYYTIDIELFLHTFDGEDVVRALVTAEWLDDHIDGGGAASSEYARAFIDGTVVDPDDVYAHSRIDPID